MSDLSLALLGTPDIRHAGQAVKFRSRKEQALLIYLAAGGGLHSREKLTALLWPESDGPQGRATLRRTLADLRSRFGAHGGPPHLIVERDLLGLDFASGVDLDVATLEIAYTSACESSTAGQAKGATGLPAILDLQRAASLYRGPFLEGFSLGEAPAFDNWIGLQREVWQHRINLVLDRISQQEFEMGKLSNAIETVTRWIALDPLHEFARRRLIEVQLAAGDHTAALRAYEAYRLRLAEELNAQPSAEMEALLARLPTGS